MLRHAKGPDQPQAELSSRLNASGGSVKVNSSKPSLVNGGTWPVPVAQVANMTDRFRCTRDIQFCHRSSKNRVQQPFLCTFSPLLAALNAPFTHVAVNSWTAVNTLAAFKAAFNARRQRFIGQSALWFWLGLPPLRARMTCYTYPVSLESNEVGMKINKQPKAQMHAAGNSVDTGALQGARRATGDEPASDCFHD